MLISRIEAREKLRAKEKADLQLLKNTINNFEKQTFGN